MATSKIVHYAFKPVSIPLTQAYNHPTAAFLVTVSVVAGFVSFYFFKSSATTSVVHGFIFLGVLISSKYAPKDSSKKTPEALPQGTQQNLQKMRSYSLLDYAAMKPIINGYKKDDENQRTKAEKYRSKKTEFEHCCHVLGIDYANIRFVWKRNNTTDKRWQALLELFPRETREIYAEQY